MKFGRDRRKKILKILRRKSVTTGKEKINIVFHAKCTGSVSRKMDGAQNLQEYQITIFIAINADLKPLYQYLTDIVKALSYSTLNPLMMRVTVKNFCRPN